LFLIPRNASGQSIGFYSLETSGNNNAFFNRTLAATMPFGTTHVQVLLWNHIYGGAIDYDNVFVTGPVTDSDGDGVDDDLDDYPNDPDRAFDVYYPNIDDYGTLAFEDLWPGKGDYDFNDLVLDYRFKQVLNGSNELVEFYMDYSVRAIGAELENGFGIAIPGTTPQSIASVSGQVFTENYVNIEANGAEAGQSEAVIILFDNAFSMIGTASGGFGINTSPDAPYVEPQWFQLSVEFANPVSIQQTGFAPYNPFLIVDKDRGREVHLPGNTPTDLHSPEWLGQWFDDSNPATGKYYQSANNLPWAIDLPVQFEYPIEKVEITDAYLNFGLWAESGGISFEDWYTNEVGYRDNDLIYTPSIR
jgi:LruC domain-containing protein